MEYINPRKRLIINRHILGNMFCLQYKVKSFLIGYHWVTVAQCPVGYMKTINKIIAELEDERECDKWNKKLGYNYN